MQAILILFVVVIVENIFRCNDDIEVKIGS